MRKESNLSTRWFAILAFVICAAMALTLALPGNVAIANAEESEEEAYGDYSVNLGTYKLVDKVVTFPAAKITAKSGAAAPKLMTVSVTEGKITVPEEALGSDVQAISNENDGTAGNTKTEATQYTFLFTGKDTTVNTLSTLLQKIEFAYEEGMRVSVHVDGNITDGFENLPSKEEGTQLVYWEENEHYYLFVPFAEKTDASTAQYRSWTYAYDASVQYKFAGKTGYLVTLDEEDEQEYLMSAIGRNFWTGATSMRTSAPTTDEVSGEETPGTAISSTNISQTLYGGNFYSPLSEAKMREIQNTENNTELVRPYYYWASGPLGENSTKVDFDLIHCAVGNNGHTEPDFYNANSQSDKISTITSDKFELCGRVFFSDKLANPNAGFYDIPEGNYSSNYYGTGGYLVEFGDWDSQDNIDPNKMDDDSRTIELPTVYHDYDNDEATGEGMDERVTANISIENYNPNYTYTYQINDKETKNQDWKTEEALTVDKESGEASVEGLVYGDHVKVNVYDEKNNLVTDDYFKVLTTEILNGDMEIVSNKEEANKIEGAAMDNTIRFFSGKMDMGTYRTQEVDTKTSGIYAWRTTATDKIIERWFEGHYMKSNVTDNFVAELNAQEKSSLYQEIITTDDELYWSVNHAARVESGNAENQDIMAIVIGPAASADYVYTKKDGKDLFMNVVEALATGEGVTMETLPAGEYKDVEYEDNTYYVRICAENVDGNWKKYEGTYRVDEDQTETVFGFTAIKSSNGRINYGNMIDGVTFSAQSYEGKLTGTPVTDKIYDGEAVEPKDDALKLTDEDGKEVTIDKVEYTWYDEDGEELEEAPTKAGSYTVKVKAKGKSGLHPYSAEAEYSFKINPKTINVNVTAEDKEYDGTTKVEFSVALANGAVVEGDDVALAEDAVTVVFADAKAGTGKTVTATLSDNALTGDDAGNYTLKIGTVNKPTITQKAVTATVTVADKTYDGKKEAGKVTATVPNDALIAGDKVEISINGTFDDADAGDEKKVTLDEANAKVTGNNSENYKISYGPAKGNIKKAPTAATGEAKPNDLTYTGEAQKLVTPDVNDPTAQLEYWDEEKGKYVDDIPTGTDAKTYTVKYRVKGDINHEAGEPKEVKVTVAKAKVPVPTTPASKVYNGETQTADVDVKDDDLYTVENKGGVNAGSYDVVYTLKDADNYEWESPEGMSVSEDGKSVTLPFVITKATPAVTAPTAKNRKADGKAQPLVTPATATAGTVQYSIDGGKTWTTTVPTATKAGTYTVYYRVVGDGNYADVPAQSVTVTITEPDYSYLLNKNVSVTEKNGKLKVTWHKVPGAEGYKVYVQYCGKKFSKKSINQVKSGKATKITVTKVNGKKRDLKKHIKLYVIAYKKVNGKEKQIAKSIIMHFVGSKNKAYTNPKKITLTKSSFTLKVGKTAKIKGKVTLANPKKKGLGNDHARVLRFRSGNKKVATVSKSGKIKAKGKGSCVIYVYARNGLTKEVKVTVK